MEIYFRVGDIVIVENKYKSYINVSIKDGYVTVFYLVNGEIEEVEVKQADLIRVSSADSSGA